MQEMDSTINSTRTTSFVISSIDRDILTYPLPSHYEIFLDEAVHDVVSMQLLVADIPFVSYLIQTNNCTLQAVLSNGVVISGVIPVGDYDGPSLAAAVQMALQGVSPLTIMTAAYSKLTDNISVSCSAAFSLVFASTGSCALELGYAVGSSNNSSLVHSSNLVTPTFRMNSHKNPSCILSILPASVNTSVNQHVNQSFAIVTPSQNDLSASSTQLAVKYFNPPIARFSRVTIDFKNYDGSQVDFQNHDHRIELLLVSLRAAKYQTSSTNAYPLKETSREGWRLAEDAGGQPRRTSAM